MPFMIVTPPTQQQHLMDTTRVLLDSIQYLHDFIQKSSTFTIDAVKQIDGMAHSIQLHTGVLVSKVDDLSRKVEEGQ